MKPRRTLSVANTSHEAPKAQARQMTQAESSVHPGPGSAKDALTEVLREGAQRMLSAAVEADVAAAPLIARRLARILEGQIHEGLVMPPLCGGEPAPSPAPSTNRRAPRSPPLVATSFQSPTRMAR